MFWLALWLVALALPAAELPGYHWTGLMTFLIGAMGATVGQFGWFANLGFLASFGLMLGNRRPGRLDLVVATLTLAAAGDALLWRKVYSDLDSAAIQSFGPGFYLWQATIVGMAASIFWLRFGPHPSLARRAPQAS